MPCVYSFFLYHIICWGLFVWCSLFYLTCFLVCIFSILYISNEVFSFHCIMHFISSISFQHEFWSIKSLKKKNQKITSFEQKKDFCLPFTFSAYASYRVRTHSLFQIFRPNSSHFQIILIWFLSISTPQAQFLSMLLIKCIPKLANFYIKHTFSRIFIEFLKNTNCIEMNFKCFKLTRARAQSEA